MLNILNYNDHPTRIGFIVFRFYEKERSDFFEELLKKESIYHELSSDEENNLFLFGVKRGDFKKASNANFLVSANFRKKIIPNIYLRWGIILLIGIMLTLAVIGSFLKT